MEFNVDPRTQARCVILSTSSHPGCGSRWCVRCTWVSAAPGLRCRCRARAGWPRRAPSSPATTTASRRTRPRRNRSPTIGNQCSSSPDPGSGHRPWYPGSSTRPDPLANRSRGPRRNRCFQTFASTSRPPSSTQTQCRSPRRSDRLRTHLSGLINGDVVLKYLYLTVYRVRYR